MTVHAISEFPPSRIVIVSAERLFDTNEYPVGAAGRSPSVNVTTVPSGRVSPAGTTVPSAGRSNDFSPPSQVAVTGNVVPSGNTAASTPSRIFRRLNVWGVTM